MKKKTWLVYLVSSCEMGSEGWSGWMYHCVAFGDTDEEIYNSWLDNVKKIYNVDLSKDLKHNIGSSTYIENGVEKTYDYDYWSCYYPIYKNELKTSVYGYSEPLIVESCYSKHKD